MEGKANSESGDPKCIYEQKPGDDTALHEPRQGGEQTAAASRITPFTNRSQIDADLALARRLQEQERAYMMLRMGERVFGMGSRFVSVGNDRDDDFYDTAIEDNRYSTNTSNSESDSHMGNENYYAYDDVPYEVENEDNESYEEQDYENSGLVYDPALYPSDEAYARALQEHEERDMAARLFAIAGTHDYEPLGRATTPQDSWEEENPDEMSYEELIALGEVVGTESRGLSPDTIASLPSTTFTSGSSQTACTDSCVICRLDFEDAETLTLLPCKHSYHLECINNWLKINKICPLCSAEVTPP